MSSVSERRRRPTVHHLLHRPLRTDHPHSVPGSRKSVPDGVNRSIPLLVDRTCKLAACVCADRTTHETADRAADHGAEARTDSGSDRTTDPGTTLRARPCAASGRRGGCCGSVDALAGIQRGIVQMINGPGLQAPRARAHSMHPGGAQVARRGKDDREAE